MEQLSKGKPYSSLKESWIVFFCTFDPFGKGLPVYTVRQTYEEAHDTKYDDGTHKVFYNASAWEKCEDEQMRAFLKLIMGMEAETDYTRQIVRVMRTSLKREDVRRSVMRLQEIIDQRAEDVINQRVEENKMLWLAQGTREKARETARRALKRGLAPDMVSEITGLSIDEVEALR